MSIYRGVALILLLLASICGGIDGISGMLGKAVDYGPTHTLFLASIASALLAQGEGRR